MISVMLHATNGSCNYFGRRAKRNPQPKKSKLNLQHKTSHVFVNKGTPFIQSVVSLKKFLLSDRVLVMSCIL